MSDPVKVEGSDNFVPHDWQFSSHLIQLNPDSIRLKPVNSPL